MSEETIIINLSTNAIKRLCAVCRNQFLTSDSENEIICQQCRSKGLKPPKPNRKYGCEKRKICQTCRYRVRIGGELMHICDCLEKTGHSRDYTADDEHCATYCRKEKQK